MKTLKKTLCLVLAMVMLFGLCAMSGSAWLEYSDNNSITYKEAVDVMSGIGVLGGDERGFRPTDDISRAEAAKIIAYIMIGDSAQADALKASSDPFTDVPASHWAAGYISYCASAGIIGGMGDGTYHPHDNVTGLAFAKMLLCALGYGVNDEYTGADWAINVSRDALRVGIFDGNTAGANNSKATREECALYAFNVVYGTDDYNGVEKVSYSALLGGYITYSALKGSTAADANKKPTFGGDFKLIFDKDDGDVFGRMAGHRWCVKTLGNPITDVYADNDDLKGEYYSKVTKGEVADLLGESFIEDVRLHGDYEVFINGVKYDKATTTKSNSMIDLTKLTKGSKANLFDEAAVSGGNTAGKTKTDKGVETLVYAGIKTVNDVDTSWIRIVIVDTYLAKVTSVSKDDVVTVALLKEDNQADDLHVGLAKDGNKISAEGFSRGDYVIVNIDDSETSTSPAGTGAVKYIEKAPTVENLVSRFQRTSSDTIFTVSGTEYKAAKNAAEDPATKLKAADDDQLNSTTMVNGNKHVLYLDGHGYAMAVADVDDTSDYVFVSHFGLIDVNGSFDSHAIGAKVHYVDGTSKVLQVNTSWGNNTTNAFYGESTSVITTATERTYNINHVGIYKLTMRDGKAVLSDYAWDANDQDRDKNATETSNDNAFNETTINAKNKQVKKSISTIIDYVGWTGTESEKHPKVVKADGDTAFFYVYAPGNGTHAENIADNWDSSSFKVTAYLGINNVRVGDNDALVNKYIAHENFEVLGTVDATHPLVGRRIAVAAWVIDGKKAKADDTVYFFTGYYDNHDKDGNRTMTVTYDTYVNGELRPLEITYDSYEAQDEAIDAFRIKTNEFFTLTSDKLPAENDHSSASSTLHEDGKTKKISDYCYEYKFEINMTDVHTDPFTFRARTPAESLSKNPDRYAYDTAVVINLVTDDKKPQIESAYDLEDALQNPTLLDGWQSISSIKVAIQYEDNSSNTVKYIYITDTAGTPKTT